MKKKPTESLNRYFADRANFKRLYRSTKPDASTYAKGNYRLTILGT